MSKQSRKAQTENKKRNNELSDTEQETASSAGQREGAQDNSSAKPDAESAESGNQAKSASGAATRTYRSSKQRTGRETSPILADPTYSELQEDNRVVMRHQIALNLESFRAATEEFDSRPAREYAPLTPIAPPFFSVIIPNYNGMAHLPTVMAALDAQTFQDFERIVVDDASRDQSLAWLEEHYPQVRLIVNRANLGFAVSCNLGAAAARGRFVVLLNSDTEPEPQWLAELVQAICRHPEAAIFASKLLLFERRDTIHSAGDALGQDFIPRNRGVWQSDSQHFSREEEVFGACGGAAVVRRDVWSQLGGFDESLWMYLEDVDFAYRSRLVGVRTVFVPTARVYHHLSATGGGTLASYYVGRNTLWTIVKNVPAELWRTSWWRILGGQADTVRRALVAYRGAEARATLRGLWDGLLGLPGILAKRRAVQAKRRIDVAELTGFIEE